jgi:hypothetical protein
MQLLNEQVITRLRLASITPVHAACMKMARKILRPTIQLATRLMCSA